MDQFHNLLTATFGGDRVRRDVPLHAYTTFRVGGPAEWLLETRGGDEIVRALQLAHAAGVAVTMLGGGSNVLIADAGIRGLVIHPRGGVIDWARDGGLGGDRDAGSPELVRADGSVTINGLVDIVEEIAGVRLKRNYNLGAPKGVNGRNSDNTLIKKYLGWAPGIRLRDGMERTYRWIYEEYLKVHRGETART